MSFWGNKIFPDFKAFYKPRQNAEYHFLLPNQGTVKQISNLDNSEEFKYSYRFVCFMDMLGCKRIVWESETSHDAFEQVKRIASGFEEAQKRYATNHWCSDFVFSIRKDGAVKDHHLTEENIRVDMSMFSDSIIISYELSDSELFLDWYRQIFQVFNDICRLQFEFALKGIFLRGGLTFGKVYHNKNVCFGPALINSVMLESQYAKYPCVAVDNLIIEKLLSDMKSNLEDDYAPGYKSPHKLNEFAQELFLDYLSRTDVFNRTPDAQPVFMLDWLTSRFVQSSSNISKIRSAILTELTKKYDKTVAEKYRWLARYFNRAIYFEEGHSDIKIENELLL